MRARGYDLLTKNRNAAGACVRWPVRLGGAKGLSARGTRRMRGERFWAGQFVCATEMGHQRVRREEREYGSPGRDFEYNAWVAGSAARGPSFWTPWPVRLREGEAARESAVSWCAVRGQDTFG